MSEINWGALQTPDYMGNALKAQQLGQQNRASQVRQNALKQYGSDPDAAIASLMEVDPEAALQLQKSRRETDAYKTRQAAGAQIASGDLSGATKTAAAGGDFDTMGEIAKLTKEQREVARQNAEDHGAYALSLKSLPYEARKAKIMADAPMLTQSGFTQEQLAGFDPTDANLDAQATSAMDLKMALAKADKDRTFTETQRHNRAGENVAQGHLAVAQGGLGVRRQEFQERKKAGGFGTPGAPAAPAGAWEEF